MRQRLDALVRAQQPPSGIPTPHGDDHDEGNVLRSPALGRRAELDRLSDDELLVRFRALPRDSHERAALCEILVERYERLVRSCVRQYRGSPEPVEDLMQVGYVGLLKAINNFDPAFGSSLSAYAAPCVSGEIKRHFRDKRWQVHVRRSAQELLLELRKATEDLTHTLGRAAH